MQFLVDFFPLLLFLGAYLKTGDLMTALKVLMVAMPIAFIVKWWLTKKMDKLLLGSTALLLIMGTATLVLNNPMFIYWKPTAFYWLVAVVFVLSQFIGAKPAVQRLFESIGEISPGQWQKLNLVWAVFFAASGFLNLYVAFNFSERFWVNFKVFGFTAITFVFVLIQTVWLVRNMKEHPPEQNEAE